MLLLLKNNLYTGIVKPKTNILLNSSMLIDEGENGQADDWSFVKNANHTGTWSIDGGQKFDLTESTEAASASYIYQSGLLGAGISIVSTVEVKTVGSLNIHVQMRYRQGGSNLSSVVTGYNPYSAWTKIKLSGTTPANTDNVALFIFLYNTSLSTGQFYIKNGKILY